jgi:hypothetical protein
MFEAFSLVTSIPPTVRPYVMGSSAQTVVDMSRDVTRKIILLVSDCRLSNCFVMMGQFINYI